MTTRAKFRCVGTDLVLSSKRNPEIPQEVFDRGEELKYAEEHGTTVSVPFHQPTVKLGAVYAPDDDDSENHRFWQASPQGEIKLTINNPAGAEVFELGREYYVDFTPAD